MSAPSRRQPLTLLALKRQPVLVSGMDGFDRFIVLAGCIEDEQGNSYPDEEWLMTTDWQEAVDFYHLNKDEALLRVFGEAFI